MRGRSLNDAFIILDEAQNTTAEQMKMFTRLGFGSKSSSPATSPGGSPRRREIRGSARRWRSDDVDDIHFAELTSADVVRHRLVSEIVDAYARAEQPITHESRPAALATVRWPQRASGVERVRPRRFRRRTRSASPASSSARWT